MTSIKNYEYEEDYTSDYEYLYEYEEEITQSVYSCTECNKE
jgi:hypothetical protein